MTEHKQKQKQKQKTLTPERLHEMLDYGPASGVFRWKVQPAHATRIQVGDRAGSLMVKGYWTITIDGEPYKAHHLAWLYTYGRWPRVDIDHINEVKDDNRITNLREDLDGLNRQNVTGPRRDNTSGYRGAFWHKRRRRWYSQIQVNGRIHPLGYFPTPEAAAEAYLAAKRELHPFWAEATEGTA